MNQRIAFLREETLSGRNKVARCKMPVMDVSGEPGGIPVRKALAFKILCDTMPLYIGPEELIVGTRTFYNFPEPGEGTVNWNCDPLRAYPKFVNEEDIRRFGGDFSGVNSQHYTPDLGILLELGVGGIIEKAKQRKEDPDMKPWNLEFLDSVIIAYTGLGDLISRYADLAEKLSAQAEGTEKKRLDTVARVCRNISTRRPADFHEAVQLLWFGHLGTILESGLFINYGRLDAILQPYLGDMSHDRARELLCCLLLKMYDQADIEDQGYFNKHEGQLVVTLGGQTPEGGSAVSDVTMLFLEAIDCTRLPEPEFNLRVTGNDPPEYLDKAAQLTVSGCNFISYYNDDTIVPALVGMGLKIEDARSYGFDLCQDLNIPGKSDFYCSGGMALAFDLMDLLLRDRDYATFEELVADYKAYMAGKNRADFAQAELAHENLIRYGEGKFDEYFANVERGVSGAWDGRHPMCPMPYLSGMFHGTVENAMDMIYESYPIKHRGAMVGVPVEGINSLAAIRKVVYDDKLYTLREVVQACREDYQGEGQEVMRNILRNAPKWGNDDPYVDLIAKDVIEYCLRELNTYTFYNGAPLLAGVHQPHPVPTGKGMMATPDGRHKGQPASVTMTPASGTMKRGATAALKSASIFDPSLLQWNYCFMINYYASVFEGERGREVFKNLLLTYFRRGGVQHQPNVLDAKKLRDAQLEPEKYKDLVVRLWGVSAHFVDLPRELQDEIIARLS